MKIPDLKNRYKRSKKYIERNFPDFYKYISENFTFCNSFPEKLYCYVNDINDKPKCIICGKNVSFRNFSVGYLKHCSCICAHKDNESLEIQSKSISKNWCENHDKILEKRTRTCLERYDVINGGGSKQSLEKYKKTCLERYNTEFFSKDKERRTRTSNTWKSKTKEQIQLFIEKRKTTYKNTYNVENQMYIPGVKEKIYNSKKKNHTFNSSSVEEKFACYLQENNIEYIRQYKSNLYPFSCDFYFPQYDLYLEIQGNWTHGGHPYNENNSEDLKQKETWLSKDTKYYNNAVENWTERDVQKRNIAKLNNLNYVECFTTNLNEIVKIFNFKTTKKSC